MLSLEEIKQKTPEEIFVTFQENEKILEQLKEYILLLKHAQFASRSEKYIDNDPQGRLFDEASVPSNPEEIEAAEAEIAVPAHTRKKRGRKPLPADFPREQIIYDLHESEKSCACGCRLSHIGDECTEQLDIIPAKITVLQHIQMKYACKTCEGTIKTAKKTKQPIPKSIAAPGLLAHVLTSKFQFHLPLYRQEQMLRNIGADIPRATLSLWVIKCGQLLQLLVNLLEDEILGYDVAFADESTLQVLKEKNKTAQSKSYMWVYGGGPPERLSYVYHYHPSRSHQVAIDFFSDFKGYLHCDGYQAYDNLSKINGKVTQVGCWYHARRKFMDAAKTSKKSGISHWFLKQIQRLAKIEALISDSEFNAEQIYAYRQSHAPEIIEKIKGKLDEYVNKVPPQSLVGKAISYTLKQWPKLLIYLEDGRLEISNNRMERAVKPFATGRKNWLFANSIDGAKAAAIIFSLVETCKTHNVNSYEWLRHALIKLPVCETVEDYEALLPFHFEKMDRKS